MHEYVAESKHWSLQVLTPEPSSRPMLMMDDKECWDHSLTLHRIELEYHSYSRPALQLARQLYDSELSGKEGNRQTQLEGQFSFCLVGSGIRMRGLKAGIGHRKKKGRPGRQDSYW
jgi:hypothetical protein